MPAASALKTLIVDDQQTMRSLIRTSLPMKSASPSKPVSPGTDWRSPRSSR